MSTRESINWVKSLNLRKSLDIPKPIESVRVNRLSMHRESFSSRIKNCFCSLQSLRDFASLLQDCDKPVTSCFVQVNIHVLVFALVQMLETNSLQNNIATSPSLNYSAIDGQSKRLSC